MVSNRSSTSSRIAASTVATGAARCRSTGDPRLAALHGDLVVLQVHDIADDTARGHDLVAALQRREQLAVALLLLALGADQHDVEDRDERGDLNQENGEPARGVLARGGEEQREHWEHGHADPDRR